MKHAYMIGAAVLALCLAPNAASANDLPANGMTVKEVARWLQDAGYQAQFQASKDGTRNIYSSAEGANFHIYFYDCKNERCGSLQFSTGYDTKGSFSAQLLNDWTAKNRWVRAYADDVNDPWLEYDVDLTPGGTYELLNDEFKIWRDSLRHFDHYVHERNQGK
ncbi:MAG: YbjN domain-containing protein [Alphaproteobacteria bacterium]|nr:YbjN domain-containing protein [Alphaproteobacteria bacterium]MDE2630214.1 YbjN domain-containing protein [Alphaproteobacteria bacterium]